VVGAMRSAGGADRPDEQVTANMEGIHNPFVGGGSNVF